MSEVGADSGPGTKFSAGVNIHVALRLSLLYTYFNKQRLTSISDIKLRLAYKACRFVSRNLIYESYY